MTPAGEGPPNYMGVLGGPSWYNQAPNLRCGPCKELCDRNRQPQHAKVIVRVRILQAKLHHVVIVQQWKANKVHVPDDLGQMAG